MFNIGGGELIVILLIALIVLGPQRLPDAARQIGKTMSELRRLSSGFQNEMKQALETADDPTRIAARRNVLARDAPADVPEGATVDATEPDGLGAASEAVDAAGADREAPPAADAAADSIAAVSGQPSAPPTQAPPAADGRAAGEKEAPTDVPEPPSPPTTS
jgi:sec-independent protein translocase protein TatB